MAEKNLGITDYAVIQAIKELHEQHEFISAWMIADTIWGEETAVYRSLKRLRDAKKIRIVGGAPVYGGSKYEIIE